MIRFVNSVKMNHSCKVLLFIRRMVFKISYRTQTLFFIAQIYALTEYLVSHSTDN